MASMRCSVFGCEERGGKQYHFPRTVERASKWKEFCQNPNLENVTLEKLHNNRHICWKHFHASSFTYPDSGRLLRTAFPTLFPPITLMAVAAQIPEPPVPVMPAPHLDNIPSPTPYNPIPSTSSDEPQSASFLESLPSTSFSIPEAENVTAKVGRTSILHELGVTRIVQMTPRKKLLFEKIKRKSKEIKRLKSNTLKLRQYIKGMKNLSTFDFVKHFKTSLSDSAIVLLTSILEGSKCKPKGMRWTHSQKLFALSLFKKSPKAYNFFRSQISLPSRSTLARVLRSLTFSTGINEEVIDFITSAVGKRKVVDRYCTLIFDEMSVKPELVYNKGTDEIDGFVDHGKRGRSNAIAKQALVFMVRGIRGKWKQPIAYYFSQGSTPGNILAELIREVLCAVNRTGLIVLATVCDMGRSNVKALQLLGASFDDPFFPFEEQRIYTIFDPPHLLKCFRNLFLKYPVRISVNIGGEPTPLVGKWQHLRALADDDQATKYLPLRLFNLTEAHLCPTSFQKMRVNLAAQVFSNHVAAGVHALVGRNVLGIDGLATAQFLMEVDSVFDSLNGTMDSKQKKPLKSAVSEDSLHMRYWSSMLKKISSWEFLGKRGVIHPPSQDGWLATIRAVMLLWDALKRMHFWHLNTRNLNQDPIENFFNVIRQNCGANHCPNTQQFRAALKTAVLNNLVSSEGTGNTEEDGCSLLINLSSFFHESGVISRRQEHDGVCERKELVLSNKKMGSVVYVGVHMVKMFLKSHPCQQCRTSLTTDPNLFQDIFYSFLFEGEAENSTCPSEVLLSVIGEGITAAHNALLQCGYNKNLSSVIAPILFESIDFQFYSCEIHQDIFKSFFISLITEVSIKQYCIKKSWMKP